MDVLSWIHIIQKRIDVKECMYFYLQNAKLMCPWSDGGQMVASGMKNTSKM